MFQIREITQLLKLENNPRLIKEEQFNKLCNSINDNPNYFNARPLILSNRTGKLVIIAGNQRYEAAKHLGLKKVPTYLLENLTEENEKEIIIRDNVNNGDWDNDILANEWDIDKLNDWGVELIAPFAGNVDDFFEETEEKEKETKPIICPHCKETFQL